MVERTWLTELRISKFVTILSRNKLLDSWKVWIAWTLHKHVLVDSLKLSPSNYGFPTQQLKCYILFLCTFNFTITQQMNGHYNYWMISKSLEKLLQEFHFRR